MKLSQICDAIGLSFEGVDKEITALNNLTDATNTQLSFLDNPKYVKSLIASKAAAVLVHPKQVDLVPEGTTALVTEEPYLMLARTTKLFAPKVLESEGEEAIVGQNSMIAPNVYLGKGVVIGSDVTIMPGAFIGDNVTIDDETIIHPNVTVYRDCKIGKRCIIHASSVVGSDGFGFAHTKTGEHIKIYQNGNVLIEDDVELGSNTSIDCGVFGPTRIGKGTKIDNLVQIGHNAQIGEGVIIVSQTGIAGSSNIGHHCVFGGQTGVVGHLTVAPFTTVASRGAIMSDIKESGLTLAGFPHVLHKDWLRMHAVVKKLLKK